MSFIPALWPISAAVIRLSIVSPFRRNNTIVSVSMVSCLNHFSYPDYPLTFVCLVLPLIDTSRNWKCRFGYDYSRCCCCCAFNISALLELNYCAIVSIRIRNVCHTMLGLWISFPSVCCKRIHNAFSHWHLSAVLQSGQSTIDIISPLAVSFCMFQVLHRLRLDAMRCDGRRPLTE